MKRYGMFRFLALSLLLGWSEVSLGATVSAETAAKVGLAFAQQNAIIKDSVTGVGTPYAFGKRWVVPLEPSGYVLLESDDTLKPVVAFATTDFPDLTGAPEGLIAFFSGEDYEEEEFTVPVADDEAEATSSEVTVEGTGIAVASLSIANVSLTSATELSMGDEENTVVSTSSTESSASETSDTDADATATGTSESTSTEPHEDWAVLLESLEEEESVDSGIMLMSDSVTIGGTTVEMDTVKYLDVATKWNQCLPYNLYAPGLTEVVGTGYGGDYGWRGAAGCVAIAEAQIAAYLRWPYRLHGTYHLNFAGNTGHLAFHQGVVPGNPYDWNAINNYSHSGCNEEPYGNEVARVINHWATCTDMYYQRSGGGGTAYWCANAKLPILGYQSVSITGSTVFSRLRASIFDYAIPAAVTIPGHAIVGAGWAENTDTALTSGSCYAYLNYGWGGGTTWYTAYDSTATDNSGRLTGTDIRIPLPYGEVTKVADTAITWYESPWWTTRNTVGTLENVTSRTLRRIAITGSTTETQTVDLGALAATDSNWTYDDNGLTRNIESGLSSTITAGTYYAGGSSVTFGLTRRTDETNTAATWEESGSTLTLQVVSLWDGTVLQTNQVQMSSTDLTTESVSITLSDLDLETPWKLMLVTSASSTEAVASIPYYITSISVANAASTTDESVTFDVSTDTDCSQSSTISGLYTRTCSDLSTLSTGDRAFYAMQIGTTDDYVWSQCLTEAAPTITWTNEIGETTSETDGWRFWLPTPDTAVTFNISDTDSTEITSVTAYLSNSLWLDPNTLTSSDGMGIVLPVADLTQIDTGETSGTNTWSCAFTFTPNPDTTVEDRLSLDSSTAVGRDAVLSIKVVDAEGNVGWSHARMTFGVTKGSLATTSGEVSTTSPTARTTDILLSSIRKTYIDLDFSKIVTAYNNAITSGQTEAEFRAAVFQLAVDAGVLPSAINAYSFDGSCSLSNGSNLSYTYSPFGQAFQIVENSEPYGGHSMGGGNTTWSAAAVIYPTAQAPTGSDSLPGILWEYGSINDGDILAVTWTRADSTTGIGTLSVYRRTNGTKTLLAETEMSATTWHLINIVYDGTTEDADGNTAPTLKIYIDGTIAKTVQDADLDGALPTSTGFQIGSIYGGMTSDFAKALGVWMDEYRGWSVALAESQLKQFWADWLPDRVFGTSTSTETTLNLSDLTWVDSDNNSVEASTFTTNTVAEITIPSGVTTFVIDSVPLNTLSLKGSGDLELTADEANAGLKFIDLTLLSGAVTFGSGTHDIVTMLYPGNTYADGAGASGDAVGLSLTGGTIALTGGTFYWPETTSATATTISVTNDVQIIAEDSLGVGMATYDFSGTSGFEAARLILSQGYAGRTAYLTLSENATGVITGSSNVDTNQSSFMVGHWDGPSTLTIKDAASLTAENAEMLVAKTRNDQTINLEDSAVLTVKGIKVSANATEGTRALNLSGGDLRLGSTGITAYGTYTIDVNVTGNSTLTATDSSVPITQPVTISSGAIWTIDGASAGNTVTLSGTVANSGTIAIAANGTLDISSATLSGDGTIDLSSGTLTIGSLRSVTASGTLGATLDITPTDDEVTAKSLSVTISGVTASNVTTSQVTLTSSDGNRLPVTAVSFADNTLTVSIGATQTIDLSTVTSFPYALSGISGVTIENGGTPARVLTAFTSDTELLALPDVENATWSVTETTDSDGTTTYTYTLTPTATELPTALTTWTFDGVDPGTEDSATMTFGRALPNLGQAGVLDSSNIITGTSSELDGSWTVSLMVFPTTSPAGDETVILSFGGELSSDVSDLVLAWERTSSTDSTTGLFTVKYGMTDSILKSDTFAAAQWHAVTLTYDGVAKRLYLTVDNTEDESKYYSTGTTSFPLPSEFSFGSGYTGLPTGYSYGTGHRVDQVRRWSSALTLAQLQAAYADLSIYALYMDSGTTSTDSVLKLFDATATVDLSTLSSSDTLWLLAFDAAEATWNVDEDVTIPVKTHIDSGTVTLARSAAGNTGVISNLYVLDNDVTIVFDESQTDYVTTRGLDPDTSTYLGTFKFVGGTEASPLVVNYTGTTVNTDYGKYAIGESSCLNIHNAGNNKVYTVTGDDPATSILMLTSAGDWGTTAQSDYSFTNLTLRLPSTLVNSTSANADFWIRPGSTSGVILDTDRKVTLEDSYSDNSTAATTTLTLAGLKGSGTLYAPSAKTINLDLVGDCTYSGSPGSNLAFVVSSATLTLSGASTTYGNSFTINDGGAVKFASSGTQTVSGVISGAGDVEIASGTVTLSATNTLTGTTTVSGGTLTLSGSVAGDIVLSGGTLNATGSASNAISVSGTSVITGTVSGAITLAEGASLDLSGATFETLPVLGSSSATLILGSAQATSSDTTYTIPSGMTVKVELASTVDLTQDFTASSLSLKDTTANVIFILTNGQEVTGSGNVLVAGTTYTWSTEDTTLTEVAWSEGAYWSTTTGSETTTGTVPPGNANIIILVPTTGLTMTIPSAVGGVAFTVNAADSASETTGTLTLTGDGSLSVTSAAINVDTELSTTGTSSLGTATIASGKTLTVGPLTTVTSASGSGTLKVTEASTLSSRSVLGDGTNLTFAGGVAHQITAASNGSGTGFVNGRTVTITGDGTTVTTPTSVGDISGYGADGSKSAIVITDGATYTLGRRDTLQALVTLCEGTFALGTSAGNSNRALDLYNPNTSFYDFTVNAASDATSENLSISYLKALNTTAGSVHRIVSIRRGDLRVKVAENAKFVIDADLSTSVSNADYTNNGGALVKDGAGILELAGDNSGQKTATTVNAGTLLLSGTLSSGALTIASGATLEVASSADLTSNFTNNGSLVVDAEASVTLNTSFLASTSGTITNNGTQNLILSQDEYQIDGYTYTKTGSGTVNFYAPGTTDISSATALEVTEDSEKGTVSWTVTPNVWTATTPLDDGIYTWSETSNWSKSELPAEGDMVVFQVSADTTLALDRDFTAVTMAFNSIATDGSTPTLTLTGAYALASDSITNTGLNVVASEPTLSWTGTLTVASGTTITVGGSDTVTGAIAGEGTLCFTSSGATYSGTIDAATNLATAESATATLTGISGTHTGTIALASDSTLTLNASVTQSGAISGAGTLATGSSITSISGAITPDDDATLSISSSASALTLTGTISGAGTLALPGTATVTISGTVTPNTTSGETLTLAPSAATTISSAFSGSGSLTFGGTGAVTLTAGTNGTTFSGTINVLDGATLVGNPSSSAFPFGNDKATLVIASGGTVKTQGDCRFWGHTTGEGNVVVETGTFYVPGNGIEITGTITIASNATLTLATPTGGSTSSMTHASVVENGTITSGSVTIPSGKTLSGSGTIRSTLTFEDGATLDATSVLTASGTVNGEGTLYVTPPETLSADTAIFTTSTDQTSSFLSTLVPTSDIATGFLKISDTGIVLQEVTLPVATVRDTTDDTSTTTITLDSASQVKLLAEIGKVATSDTTTIDSVIGETNTGAETATTLSEAELEGALALFENIVTLETSSTTTDSTESTSTTTTVAKVAYDFGVTAITVKSIGDDTCVVITAKVSNASNNSSTAAFASGTTVTVTATDGDGTTKSITATEVTSEEGTTAGATSETGVKYFKVPLTELGDSGTVQFSVKASNTTTTAE